MLQINVEPGAYYPRKLHQNQAIYELRTKFTFTIKPFENRLISTGVRVKIPKDELGMVVAKNSINRESLLVFPTIYDCTFDGYLGVQCFSLSEEPLTIKKGDGLAQFIIYKLSSQMFEEMEELDSTRFSKLFSRI